MRTVVMPEDMISSGAVSRSRLERFILPRKFFWVSERTSSRRMMAEKLKYFMMRSRMEPGCCTVLVLFSFISDDLLTSSG